MPDIGREVKKDCDYCGKPLFAYYGRSDRPGYHLGCLRKSLVEKNLARRLTKKLNKIKIA